MPKPVNPSIGACPCSMKGCNSVADVKKEKGKRKRLYLVCPTHGVINLGGQAQQEFILENARMNGPDGAAPVPKQSEEPGQEPGPARAGNIERGPKPEPYPDGVQLTKPGQERAKAKPEQGPEPVKKPGPEPKQERGQPKQQGGGMLGWLKEGLEAL